MIELESSLIEVNQKTYRIEECSRKGERTGCEVELRENKKIQVCICLFTHSLLKKKCVFMCMYVGLCVCQTVFRGSGFDFRRIIFFFKGAQKK